MADFNATLVTTANLDAVKSTTFKSARTGDNFPVGSELIFTGEVRYYQVGHNYYPVLVAKLENIEKEVWCSTILRTAIDSEERRSVEPSGFNALCRALSLRNKTNEEAVNLILEAAKDANGQFRPLVIDKLPYVGRSIETGKPVDKALIQFSFKD